MSGLAGIPIAVESEVQEHLSANVIALLHEITTLQEQFIASGDIGQIDLKTLPLTEGEHKALDAILKTGELRCELDAAGRSEIFETVLPGVWRMRYFNIDDELIAELIEISEIPEILKADIGEMEEGMNALKAQLSEMANNIIVDGE